MEQNSQKGMMGGALAEEEAMLIEIGIAHRIDQLVHSGRKKFRGRPPAFVDTTRLAEVTPFTSNARAVSRAPTPRVFRSEGRPQDESHLHERRRCSPHFSTRAGGPTDDSGNARGSARSAIIDVTLAAST